MKIKLWILRVVWSLNFAFTTGVALADAPLRPGDQIEMKLSGVPSTEISAVSGIYTVDGEGSVNLPHIGRLKIAELTPGAAESAIESVYKSRDIYTNPTVVITMQAQSRFVNVGGEVKAPQRISFTPDLTILSAINAAGGFSPYADGRKVRLLRANKLLVIDVNKIRANPSLDLQVEPGDRIEAPSIFQNSKNSQGNLQQGAQIREAIPAQSGNVQTQVNQAQDEIQQSQPGPGLDSNRGADLETQLKQTQANLQRAQQNAKQVSDERAALETQLHETKDQLRQALQNAELASSQRAALETQLKETQQELQQAQQNAELASSQRAALEARLKKTEESQPPTEPAATQGTVATAKKTPAGPLPAGE